MLVRLRIWFEIASKVCGARTSAFDPFVTFDNGASVSLLAICCNANIVADCGGVFSPRILCGGLLKEGLKEGVSRTGVSRPGVGVEARLPSLSGDFSGDLSGDLPSEKKSLAVCGVTGLFVLFSGEGVGDPKVEAPSRKLIKSRTFPV
jgi:hypothetical protein